MLRTVTWRSLSRLSCSDEPGANLVVVFDRTLTTDTYRDAYYGYIDATLGISSRCGGQCGDTWLYPLIYDDTYLNPGEILDPADVKGVFCVTPMIRWIQYQIANIPAGGGGIMTDVNILLTEATFDPIVPVDATTLTNAYSVLLTDTNDKRFVKVVSTSDQPIAISFDGINDHDILLGSNESSRYDLAAQGKKVSTSVYVRALATIPTDGDVYCAAFY